MPKPDSLQGALDLVVLKVLSRRPGLHGYVATEESQWQTVTSAINRVLRTV